MFLLNVDQKSCSINVKYWINFLFSLLWISCWLPCCTVFFCLRVGDLVIPLRLPISLEREREDCGAKSAAEFTPTLLTAIPLK